MKFPLISKVTLAGFLLLSTVACGQSSPQSVAKETSEKVEVQHAIQPKKVYTTADYLLEDAELDALVEKIFLSMDDTARVAQTLMPAVGRLGFSNDKITGLIQKRLIGGVLMLNGSKSEFTSWIAAYEALNAKKGNLPFLYSADAEPSLFNRKISETPIVKKASEITSIEEAAKVAEVIAGQLKEIGINYNFAPVVDLAKNKTVGYRGFGAVEANNIPWSNAFITATQKAGVIATAKHFPGHGLVSGDTHHSLQAIDGTLKEVPTYPGLIKNGVLSIMIGHLAVINNPKYDTKGLPATLSSVIVSDLLRGELGFKGLVVTDAMNMGGVASVPNCDLKALEAGCDIVLMPMNVEKSHASILAKYQSDSLFKAQMDASVKRIIRMKLCVGAIK